MHYNSFQYNRNSNPLSIMSVILIKKMVPKQLCDPPVEKKHKSGEKHQFQAAAMISLSTRGQRRRSDARL